MTNQVHLIFQTFSNTVSLIAVLSLIALYRKSKNKLFAYYSAFLISFALMFAVDYIFTIIGFEYEYSKFSIKASILELISETITNSILITTTLFITYLIPLKHNKKIITLFCSLFTVSSILMILFLGFFKDLEFVYKVIVNISFLLLAVMVIFVLISKYTHIQSNNLRKFLKTAFIITIIFFPLILLFEVFQLEISTFPLINNLEFDLLFFSIWNIASMLFLLKNFTTYVDNSFVVTPSDDFFRKIGLSNREIEVFHKIISGKSYSEVADDLTISPVTVKTHVLNIYRKAGVKNKLSLIHKLKESHI